MPIPKQLIFCRVDPGDPQMCWPELYSLSKSGVIEKAGNLPTTPFALLQRRLSTDSFNRAWWPAMRIEEANRIDEVDYHDDLEQDEEG